jgi:hypothetical protein
MYVRSTDATQIMNKARNNDHFDSESEYSRKPPNRPQIKVQNNIEPEMKSFRNEKLLTLEMICDALQVKKYYQVMLK